MPEFDIGDPPSTAGDSTATPKTTTLIAKESTTTTTTNNNKGQSTHMNATTFAVSTKAADIQTVNAVSTTIPIAVSCLHTAVVSDSVVSTVIDTTTSTPNGSIPTGDESDTSNYTVEVIIPDYVTSTPSKVISDSPGKNSRNSSPGKSQYHQLDLALVGISTRLSNLESGIFTRLSKIEAQLARLTSGSLSTSPGTSLSTTPGTSTSSSEDLWPGWDEDISGEFYLFGNTQPGVSSTNVETPVISANLTYTTLNPTSTLSTAHTHVTACLQSTYIPTSIPVPIPAPLPASIPAPIPPTGFVATANNVSQIGTFLGISAPIASTGFAAAAAAVSNVSQMCTFLGISDAEINDIKKDASSRKKFSARVVKRIFSEEERRRSNCMGKKGKDRFDPT